MQQDFFFIRVNKKNVKVKYSDISCVEASRNYIRINTGQQSFMVLLSMRQVEELLPPCTFCRVHRSYIVSLQHLTSFDNTCVYINEKIIPVGEQYKNVLPQMVTVVHSDVRRPTDIKMGTYEIMETAN